MLLSALSHPVFVRALPAVVALLLATSCAASDTAAVNGPDDFVELVDSILQKTRSRLPNIAECVDGMVFETSRDLDDRATYADGVVTVRIPATAPHLETVIVHEVAHHLDATCPLVTDGLRSRFKLALDSEHSWDRGPSWEETPAELFAEAVSEVVLDRRRANNTRLTPDSIEVVRSWAGQPLSRD